MFLGCQEPSGSLQILSPASRAALPLSTLPLVGVPSVLACGSVGGTEEGVSWELDTTEAEMWLGLGLLGGRCMAWWSGSSIHTPLLTHPSLHECWTSDMVKVLKSGILGRLSLGATKLNHWTADPAHGLSVGPGLMMRMGVPA